MSSWKCNACGGVYQDEQPGGGRYYHVCGFIVDLETGKTTMLAGHRDERPEPGSPPGTGLIVSVGAGRTEVDAEPAAAADAADAPAVETEAAADSGTAETTAGV